MQPRRTAVVFSGQGTARESAAEPGAISDAFDEVNDVALERLELRVPRVLARSHCRRVNRRPELVQLTVYGLSIAAYRCRPPALVQPAVLVGHGLGELIALVCAGGFSVAEGAEIICHRAAVLKTHCHGAGSMLSLDAHCPVAEALVKLVRPHQAAVAAENTTSETIVSGSYEALDRIASLALALNIRVKRLRAPYPLHCGSMMADAATDLGDRLLPMPGRALSTPVFSPILGRHYSAVDHLGVCVAEHLGKPIRFSGAVCRLREMGIDAFVEGGVLDGGYVPQSTELCTDPARPDLVGTH